MSEEIDVNIRTFKELFETATFPLALDSYQRPYVWSREKTNQLLSDLKEYNEINNPQLKYYMATILLHRSEGNKKIFIIDGQQRITTLSVLHNELCFKLPENLELKFNSKLSVNNIQETKNVLKLNNSGLKSDVFERICFTVITVFDEDLAFIFFDTQNNRGVPLAATDLLKAYHLRAIGCEGNSSKQLKKFSAERWEAIQKMHKDKDFAQILFNSYLWKCRNWKGRRVTVQENHNDILRTFQAESIKSANLLEIPLYAGTSNQWAQSIKLTERNSFSLTLRPVALEGDASSLPFSLRQPIHDGCGFFLYAQKYASLLYGLQNVIDAETHSSELGKFHVFFKEVIEGSGLIGYLKHLFWLSTLMYVDRFGFNGLLSFAEALNYSIGALRVEKKSIQKETPVKYLRDRDVNLLDCLASAYRPKEVIDHLMLDPEAKRVYSNRDILNSIKEGRVQHRYLLKVQGYYKRSDWENRHLWSVHK